MSGPQPSPPAFFFVSGGLEVIQSLLYHVPPGLGTALHLPSDPQVSQVKPEFEADWVVYLTLRDKNSQPSNPAQPS